MPEVAEKDRIMDMVRKELEKDPGIENKELYAKASDIDESVEDLTLRQFHARYPLQVKRQMAQDSGGAKKKKKRKKKSGTSRKGATSGGRGDGSGGVDRERIRSTLLRFARDVSAAEGKAEMIDLLSSVDDYVDDIAGAVGTG
jgi:hypothetical protein